MTDGLDYVRKDGMTVGFPIEFSMSNSTDADFFNGMVTIAASGPEGLIALIRVTERDLLRDRQEMLARKLHHLGACVGEVL